MRFHGRLLAETAETHPERLESWVDPKIPDGDSPLHVHSGVKKEKTEFTESQRLAGLHTKGTGINLLRSERNYHFQIRSARKDVQRSLSIVSVFVQLHQHEPFRVERPTRNRTACRKAEDGL